MSDISNIISNRKYYNRFSPAIMRKLADDLAQFMPKKQETISLPSGGFARVSLGRGGQNVTQSNNQSSDTDVSAALDLQCYRCNKQIIVKREPLNMVLQGRQMPTNTVTYRLACHGHAQSMNVPLRHGRRDIEFESVRRMLNMMPEFDDPVNPRRKKQKSNASIPSIEDVVNSSWMSPTLEQAAIIDAGPIQINLSNPFESEPVFVDTQAAIRARRALEDERRNAKRTEAQRKREEELLAQELRQLKDLNPTRTFDLD